MKALSTLYSRHRAGVLAALAAGLCLVLAALLWLAQVRPNAAKSLSTRLSDDYTLQSDPIEDGVTQTFSTDEDLLAIGFVFGTAGDQPAGALELTLADADTGEVLARSTGEMANIIPGQYTALGLDAPVAGVAGRRYLVTLAPAYSGEGRLTIGHSDGATLWEDTLTVNGQAVDGTLALLITTRTIGGFLSRFFLAVAVAAAALAFLGIRAALRHKIALHKLVFGLVLGFGLLYCAVLPPYAAPDEKYHINQSFTLACRWANLFSEEDWRMGNVPINTSYRREHDQNALLQNENTTVFTWQEMTENLLTLSPDAFDSHVELAEYQTDRNPLLYLVSAAGVFLGFVLRLGFVPTLLLGRLANLLLFAALAAVAVRWAPFGRRVLAAAALLPMTLHLAASFSRDSVLLGLAFAFTGLCLRAIFGDEGKPMAAPLALGLALCGVLLAPAKVVYLPLAALFLLVPAVRLGRRPALKKAAYALACLALVFLLNGAMLAGQLSPEPAQAEAETTSAETVAAETVAAAPQHAAPEPETTAAAADTGETAADDYLAAMPEDYYERTPEGFVKRLYYCVERRTDVAESEIAFWAQALREGDVTAALLGQSFFFSPAEMESTALTDEEFIRAAALCYLDRDTLREKPDEAAGTLELFAEIGRVAFFKGYYSSEECANLMAESGIQPGMEDAARYPLDRSELAAEVEAARAVRATQSTAAPEDEITFTPGYILTHIPATVLLVVRTLAAETDDALRGLVGGLLSYNSLELGWGWVIALYLLLAFAALPAEGEGEGSGPLAGRYRVLCLLAALCCCALVLAGCIVWTPTYYETVYGFQGRYLLPVLPLALLAGAPRGIRLPGGREAEGQLVTALCLVQVGVLLNIMLAVIAR